MSKRIKRASENAQQREKRLSNNRVRKQNRRFTDHTNHQDATRSQVIDDHCLPEYDRKLLHSFRSKIDKLSNNLCPVCNECFPSIEIVQGECCRCYMEGNEVKKFSTKNNMDPGEVPKELRGLTQIEEMLIAQIFPIISVYYLRGGQYAYRGNVINFPQDVQEFATRLPRRLMSLLCVIALLMLEHLKISTYVVPWYLVLFTG